MRASTSGHAILIRDEGNTDPSHDGKMLAKPRYKNPAQVLSLDKHETYPTPPAPEGSKSPYFGLFFIPEHNGKNKKNTGDAASPYSVVE